MSKTHDPLAVERLTPRERECLRLVADHLHSKEIARRLSISQHTVEGHLNEARRRLGVASRREAARLLVAWEADNPPLKDLGGVPPLGAVLVGDPSVLSRFLRVTDDGKRRRRARGADEGGTRTVTSRGGHADLDLEPVRARAERVGGRPTSARRGRISPTDQPQAGPTPAFEPLAESSVLHQVGDHGRTFQANEMLSNLESPTAIFSDEHVAVVIALFIFAASFVIGNALGGPKFGALALLITLCLSVVPLAYVARKGGD